MSGPDFILLGAGLPRTGTMSQRLALRKLLDGDVYHMQTLGGERPDHIDFWRCAAVGKVSKADWDETLKDFKGGVDYPISLFWKDLMKYYPDSKILLSVRDPVRWYESVRDSIMRLTDDTKRWPMTWFLQLTGMNRTFDTVKLLTDVPPDHSKTGLGMFESVRAGKETAVQFFNDHINEVKSVVPADRLLVWEAKDGWEPLCKFLDVPVPNEPFPRVNDTVSMNARRQAIVRMAWFLIVILPLGLAAAAWLLSINQPVHYLMLAGGYLLFLLVLKVFMKMIFAVPKKDKLQ